MDSVRFGACFTPRSESYFRCVLKIVIHPSFVIARTLARPQCHKRAGSCRADHFWVGAWDGGRSGLALAFVVPPHHSVPRSAHWSNIFLGDALDSAFLRFEFRFNFWNSDERRFEERKTNSFFRKMKKAIINLVGDVLGGNFFLAERFCDIYVYIYIYMHKSIKKKQYIYIYIYIYITEWFH